MPGSVAILQKEIERNFSMLPIARGTSSEPDNDFIFPIQVKF